MLLRTKFTDSLIGFTMYSVKDTIWHMPRTGHRLYPLARFHQKEDITLDMHTLGCGESDERW